MGRRRDSHRRHRELSDDELFDLLGWGPPAFETDEAVGPRGRSTARA